MTPAGRCSRQTLAVEDVNPEDPAIWQFSRKPVPQQYSFFQHVHSLFGKSFENEGHPQARRAAMQEKLLAYRLLVSEQMLAQGLSNLGDSRRMERFFEKLLRGDPVTMVTLGGSISAGQGVSVPGDAYIPRVYDWIQTVFPNKKHRFLNRALPGTTSAYVSPCALQMVPPEADFVLLEYTFNDAERAYEGQSADDPTRRGFERLIRKMLLLPERPAVMYFHVWTPRRLGFRFFESPENMIEMVPEYYGLPSISMRNAMYHIVENLTVPADWLWRSDINHANCLGHRYMADLIIGYFQNIALHMVDQASDGGGGALQHEGPVMEALPEPMFVGNSEAHASHCRMDEDFRALVSSEQGWRWVNEGKSPERPKWGFVTEREGDSLTVRVPTEGFVPVEGEPIDDSPLTIGVSCLMSYEHTGAVLLECEEGCRCRKREYSLRHWNHVSLVYWKPLLEVSLDNGTNHCTVRVTNPVRNASDTKLKVSGVMITREDFMVSIFDYNKDAEDAERAEKAVASGTAERNLSDGPGRRGGCGGGGTAGGGGAEGSGGRSHPCEDGEGRFAGWQWVVPAWAVAAVLAVALVWDKQASLGGMMRACRQHMAWPRARRRLFFCSERGCSGGKCAA
ncbi:g7760 [Coccomyxa elongata]